MRVSFLKKYLILAGAATTVSLLSITNLRAQSDTEYLFFIKQYTYGTLLAINDLSSKLFKEDDSDSTAKLQSDFATLGNLIVQNFNTQNSYQKQLTADLFGQPIASFTTPIDTPGVLRVIPNINDLAYSTMLGLPPVPKAPALPLNYVKNAGGLTLTHTIPNLSWQGPEEDQKRYQNYYNTIMSVESFNGYVLSNQYADFQNGNSFTTTQNELISQASNSEWISQIASEELGKVFRQILMFESQNYILTTQLVQLQKQLLTAQVMNNALTILTQQNSEDLLVANAQGVRPS